MVDANIQYALQRAAKPSRGGFTSHVGSERVHHRVSDFQRHENAVDIHGRAAEDVIFGKPHPEVYARVEVNVRSPGATVALLSLRDEAGNVFRVVLGHDGRLAFENGAAAAPTVLASAQGLGSGWHTVTLHVWERGAHGTCDVFYDGDPVAGLDLMSSCPTGSTMIRSYAIGPPGGGSGSVQFRNPALATSPL